MNCHFCERHCDLAKGKSFCGMYMREGTEIIECFPDHWSTYAASRVESVPFYHAYPGARAMIIGSAGCNFRCRYCSNAFIACREPADLADAMYRFEPESLVAMARKLGCHNIIFNVNEPAVSLPSLERVGIHAKKAGIPMGCLTNGYTTQEASERMAHIFSFLHIGLKGFTDGFHQKYVGIPKVGPILRNIQYFANHCHLEIATPVIQGVNDHELDDISRFIRDVTPDMPWHVFRLLPEHQMKEAQYPDINQVNQALTDARQRLSYVYFHNFVGSDWVNTSCPTCGRIVIKRFSLGCSGDRLDQFLAPGNLCPGCDAPIPIHGTFVEWHANRFTPDHVKGGAL